MRRQGREGSLQAGVGDCKMFDQSTDQLQNSRIERGDDLILLPLYFYAVEAYLKVVLVLCSVATGV